MNYSQLFSYIISFFSLQCKSYPNFSRHVKNFPGKWRKNRGMPSKVFSEKKISMAKAYSSISQLPDEILSSILSCLPLKEAAKTSVLSHRWENLWQFSSAVVLDFDGTKTLLDLKCRWSKSLKTQRVRFTDSVNRILRLHHGNSIDEFRVFFDLDMRSSSDIDSWIEFALRKGVKRLELDFRSWVCSIQVQ